VDLVPAALARRLGVDIVVAVDVSGPLLHRPPTTLLQIMVAASTPAARRGRTARPRRRSGPGPAVDEYAFWELSRIPDFEQASRAAVERALPLLRALTSVAQVRRDWQQTAAG
jgi:NTE family protein